MFHSRGSNNKINRLYERSLRIVYDDYYSSFEELFKRDGSFSVHHSNIQTLAIKMCKVLNDSLKFSLKIY